MRGITFGVPTFETAVGSIQPDAEVYFAVLLCAAVAPSDVGVPRDDLASLIWPESPLDAARHSLRQAMYRVRQLGIGLHLRRGQVVLDEDDAEVDIRELMHGPMARDELLRIATQPFLPGYSPRLGTPYSGWLQDLRDRADRIRRHALVEAVREARAQARFREIHKLARALLSLDPLNETATLALAEALVMDGSKVEALRMLDEYEAEVGSISEALRVPVRTLRRRVSECMDEALLPRRFEVPFVGRESEFRALREGFVSTRQGKGLCFVITGEPGIGKTRIANELLRLSVLDGAMVITYSCTSGDALTPLSSLLTLTQSLLGQPGALGCGSEHLQYLRRLLAPDSAGPGVGGGMAADIAYAQLVYSLSELTAAITDEGPLVVFVDDAHRLHQTSWRIFSDVVDRLPEKRVLLVFAARQLPEWYGSLGINGSDGRSRHVALPTFSIDASRSFLDLWSEKNAVDTSGYDTEGLAGTAGGNPFYLGELVAHRARGGVAGEVPASLKGLVQLQYAALRKPAQRALLVIGLLQAHATVGRVASILRLPPATFVEVLDELESAGLLVSNGALIRARHDLIVEVCLGLAPVAVLQYLRTRVAARLEREGERTDSIDLLSDALMHWERAGLHDSIFRASCRLGAKLLVVGLSIDAAIAYQRALNHATAEAQRDAALVGIARAMTAANAWGDLCRLHDEWKSTLQGAQDGNLTEVLLGVTEAGLWARALVPEPGILESIFEDASRDGSLRARAAILAVIAADNNLTAPEYLSSRTQTLMSVAMAEGVRFETGLLLRLVVAVSKGNREEALPIAHRYADLALRSPQGEGVRALRHAAHAMLRLGLPISAGELFQASYALAVKLKLPVHQAACLELLGRIACHSGDLIASSQYTAQLVQLVHQRQLGSLFESWAIFAAADNAFLLRDADLAAEAKDLLDRVRPDGDLSVARHSMFTARVALSFLFPELLDDPTRNWCRALPASHLARGAQDLTAIVVASALLNIGEIAQSKAFLGEYFSRHRIEETPIASTLCALVPEALLDIVHNTRKHYDRSATQPP